MRNPFPWLWNNSEKLSHLATALAFIVAAVGSFLAYGQLKATSAQLEQANDQRRWQNYNEMNVRYAELYKSIPEEIASGCVPKRFEMLKPETKRWVRQYFDLYSEEYWLVQNNLIPEQMWSRRIYGGVRVNLAKYPTLIDGYHYWKAVGAFTHPDTFQKEAELAIAESKSPPYSSSSNGLCVPPIAPNPTVHRTLRDKAAQRR